MRGGDLRPLAARLDALEAARRGVAASWPTLAQWRATRGVGCASGDWLARVAIRRASAAEVLAEDGPGYDLDMLEAAAERTDGHHTTGAARDPASSDGRQLSRVDAAMQAWRQTPEGREAERRRRDRAEHDAAGL